MAFRVLHERSNNIPVQEETEVARSKREPSSERELRKPAQALKIGKNVKRSKSDSSLELHKPKKSRKNGDRSNLPFTIYEETGIENFVKYPDDEQSRLTTTNINAISTWVTTVNEEVVSGTESLHCHPGTASSDQSWHDLAEERRLALEQCMLENKMLYEMMDVLKEENQALSDMVSKAEEYSKEKVPYEDAGSQTD